MPTIYYYVIIALVVLLVLFTLAIVLLKKRSKKTKEIDVSLELEPIYQALGFNNLLKVEKIQDRIRLEIKEKKLINVKELQSLGIMATIKGLELTILYRKNSDELYRYLKDKVQ